MPHLDEIHLVHWKQLKPRSRNGMSPEQLTVLKGPWHGDKLKWPTAEEVAAANMRRNPQEDDHLLLGITCAAAMDFLMASGWQMRANGKYIGTGNANGYDISKHVREFMPEKMYTEFSAAEVFLAAGYPKMGYADAFLSHAQSEVFSDTMKLLEKAAQMMDHSIRSKVFLDYFCLRQCISDFIPVKICEAIGKIGFTVAGMTLSDDGQSSKMMGRVWCCFEIYCTIVTGSRFWAKTPKCSAYYPTCLPKSALKVDLHQCDSAFSEDKDKLMSWLAELEGGVQAANEVVSTAMCAVQRNNVRTRYTCRLTLVVFGVLAELAIILAIFEQNIACLIVSVLMLCPMFYFICMMGFLDKVERKGLSIQLPRCPAPLGKSLMVDDVNLCFPSHKLNAEDETASQSALSSTAPVHVSSGSDASISRLIEPKRKSLTWWTGCVPCL